MKNMKESIEKLLNTIVDDRKIQRIAEYKDVNKDFRYSIAKETLNKNEFFVYLDYTKTPDPQTDWFRGELKKFVEGMLSFRAFHATNFGRKRNIFRGGNNPFQIKNGNLFEVDTFRYKGDFKGKAGYKYYSNYALVYHRTKREVLYRIPGMEKPVKYTFRNISEEQRISEFFRHLTSENYCPATKMIHASTLPRLQKIARFDEKECSYTYHGFEYHLSEWIKKDEIKLTEIRVVTAFQQRKKELINERELIEKAEKVEVNVSDSIQSGNCKIGTENFREKLIKNKIIDNDQKTINGKKLLDFKFDQFTKRAVYQAIKRGNF